MAYSRFSTAINCMDGRVQIPIIDYIRLHFGAEYVDMITEPGPNKILAENNDITHVASIKKRVAISVERHHSRLIAIVGHHDCAGNPADEDTQRDHIISAIKTINSWRFNAQAIGLWVDEHWRVCEIDRFLRLEEN